MKTLYLDISSDKVYLTYEGKELFLERNTIEDTLGKVLIQRWKNYQFTKVALLNGPWGFTNLRVGSLCVNLLNALVGDQIDFSSMSKIELYQYAYKQGHLPRYGIIYIGQKKNIWLWDFEKKEKIWQMNFEHLAQTLQDTEFEKEPLFLDIVYEPRYYPDFLHNYPQLSYKQVKQWMDDYLKMVQPPSTKAVKANYMINPIITPCKR